MWHPRRTIWPTRDGWWSLFVAVGLGVAAINTGNNLLYLLVSLVLGLIVVSGVLSEQTMRGLRLTGAVPEEIYAGRPALFGAGIANGKRWLTSYSVTLELLAPEAWADTAAGAGRARFLYLPRLEAGADRLVTWEETLPRRGRHRLAGVRITTRFPFALFLKAGRPALDSEVVVYPAVKPVSSALLREIVGSGDAPTRRRGRGSDLYNLRGYRPGDDPRLIHWRSSAKTQTLTIRELEAESTEDTRIVLTGAASGDSALLEAGLSEAASVAVHLLRAGSGIELVGPDIIVKLGRGRGQIRRVLTALALYQPGAGPVEVLEAEDVGDGDPRREGRALRELRIRIG